jgi:hypothetical protein
MIISEVNYAVKEQNSYGNGYPSPADRLDRVEPGQLVRVVDGPPGVIYCSPSGEWDLWVDELRSRHGGSTAVVLEYPRSTYGAVTRGRPDFPPPERSTMQVSHDAHYNPKRAVMVMMDDGWIGKVWLGALREVG